MICRLLLIVANHWSDLPVIYVIKESDRLIESSAKCRTSILLRRRLLYVDNLRLLLSLLLWLLGNILDAWLWLYIDNLRLLLNLLLLLSLLLFLCRILGRISESKTRLTSRFLASFILFLRCLLLLCF